MSGNSDKRVHYNSLHKENSKHAFDVSIINMKTSQFRCQLIISKQGIQPKYVLMEQNWKTKWFGCKAVKKMTHHLQMVFPLGWKRSYTEIKNRHLKAPNSFSSSIMMLNNFTYPKMTAFQTMILFSDGAPLTPAGGSSCSLTHIATNVSQCAREDVWHATKVGWPLRISN